MKRGVNMSEIVSTIDDRHDRDSATNAAQSLNNSQTQEPADNAKRRTSQAARKVGQAWSGGQFFLAVAALVASVIVGWKLIGNSGPATIETVQLNAIVGEYVRAQARSGNSEQDAAAQTAAFMSALDNVLQKKAADGRLILVSDAIVAGAAQDITNSIRDEVYSQVALPAPVTQSAVAGDMRNYLQSGEGE
ncbi:hypothetical protein D6851_15715 [Altericroceibacterium spongiae]|uniref:Conjugal transfer protein TrbI n=1 Tax=Altericroceibacterium spongiae TaxID=2320269 RepID=A0A420EAK3_9SPHN|nr:TrbI F-type domain-containing protein [Altericroceibacterium spongiae]RKF17705.1 hypothetical protein D6851_15715 [Altericroceibacterium spongiae]